MKDFYYILGTARNATQPEIEAAYQKLARKFGQTAEEQDDFMDAHFREIAEAYDVLRDTRRRGKYDAAVKRNQNRHLAAFRLKYLNMALSLTFLVVTALFTRYVIRSIRGHAAKKIVQKPSVQTQAIAIIHSKKHHKAAMSAVKRRLPLTDTARKQPHPVIIVTPPPPFADSTYTATLHANITGIVYLHQAPDYNSPVLARIPDATGVRVIQKGQVYYKITFNHQKGYVLKSCITER